MESKKFKTNPIVEAVVDIEFAKEEINFTQIADNMAALVKNDYSERAKRLAATGSFLVKKDDETIHASASEPIVDAYRFKNKDGVSYFIIKETGFSFSHLSPYEGWIKLQTSFNELWTKYKSLLPTINLTRISIRYINRIVIKKTSFELDEYFTTLPKLGDGLSDFKTVNFFNQIAIENKDIDAIGYIVQGIEESTEEGSTSIILDITASKNFDKGDDNINTHLEELRDFKNNIFFNSITENTKSFFQ